jgi:hypothetical protein
MDVFSGVTVMSSLSYHYVVPPATIMLSLRYQYVVPTGLRYVIPTGL